MSFPAAAQSDLLGLHQRSACARYNRKPGLLRVYMAFNTVNFKGLFFTTST